MSKGERLDELRALGMKLCYCCKVEKSVSGFSKSKTRCDGLQPKCKSCHAEYRAKNAERISLQKAGKSPSVDEKYPDGLQTCEVCKKNKTLSEFQEFIVPRNTFRTSCNDCHELHYADQAKIKGARNKKWKLDNPEWCKKYYAEWNSKNIESRRRTYRNYYYRNIEKYRAYTEQYRAKNIDLIRKKYRDWYAANPAKARSKHRKYYEKNKESESRRNKIYRQENPDIVRMQWRLRGARKRGATGSYTSKDIDSLMESQRGKCAHKWCKRSVKIEYHIDHIMPIVRGGSNDKYNLQLLCPTCNLRKGAKHPIDFAQENGLLL